MNEDDSAGNSNPDRVFEVIPERLEVLRTPKELISFCIEGWTFNSVVRFYTGDILEAVRRYHTMVRDTVDESLGQVIKLMMICYPLPDEVDATEMARIFVAGNLSAIAVPMAMWTPDATGDEIAEGAAEFLRQQSGE
jgi:hypothetical protein